jgi:hypothetical protein
MLPAAAGTAQAKIAGWDFRDEIGLVAALELRSRVVGSSRPYNWINQTRERFERVTQRRRLTGTVGAFTVNSNGTLTPLPDTPGLVAQAGYMGLAAF